MRDKRNALSGTLCKEALTAKVSFPLLRNIGAAHPYLPPFPPRKLEAFTAVAPSLPPIRKASTRHDSNCIRSIPISISIARLARNLLPYPTPHRS